MARKQKSVADIDKEIEALEAQRAAALNTRSEQIGKLAGKAELNVLDIPDSFLLKEFKAIAERFRNSRKTQGVASN